MINSLLGPAIKIALGIIFIYFVLSFVCSSINELFAALFRLRAENLVSGLVRLIGEDLTRKLLDHPLIQKSKQKPESDKSNKPTPMPPAPTYIAPGSFALAMFDLFAPVQDGPLTV